MAVAQAAENHGDERDLMIYLVSYILYIYILMRYIYIDQFRPEPTHKIH